MTNRICGRLAYHSKDFSDRQREWPGSIRDFPWKLNYFNRKGIFEYRLADEKFDEILNIIK